MLSKHAATRRIGICVRRGFRRNLGRDAVLFGLGNFARIHDELKLRAIDRLQSEPVNARLFFGSSEALLAAGFFAQLILVQFIAPNGFIKRNAVFVELMAETLQIFHHITKFRIGRHPRCGTAFQLVDKERMKV